MEAVFLKAEYKDFFEDLFVTAGKERIG